MANNFDERTKFAWPIVIVIVGGAAFITNLNIQLTYAQKKLDEVIVNQDKYTQNLEKILLELARIQGKLGLVPTPPNGR